MEVPEEDLRRLYAEPGVDMYVPETFTVTLGDGRHETAVGYNLPPSLLDAKPNVAYAEKLQRLGMKLGLPAEYLAQMRAAAEDAP